MKKRAFYLAAIASLSIAGTLTWTLAARAGNESAEYRVIESDGNIEIREYPDLVLASTQADFGERGNDGSFMRLFRYISGANKSEEKIAMTTPVFMEGQSNEAKGSMAFVMPKKMVATGAPDPEADQVKIRERKGGRFAVIRFAGKLDAALARKQEAQLRAWMDQRGLEGSKTAETAGYDPPFTPGPLRRNEVLIRLK